MKYSKTSIKRNKCAEAASERTDTSSTNHRSGFRVFSFYTLTSRFTEIFHSVEKHRNVRDLKSNPLLVGELTTQSGIAQSKNIFPEMGAGCSNNQMFC
jgi:hypothetical protein